MTYLDTIFKMNTTQISVPHGDCILSVNHTKRTVSLLRTGKRGATQYGKTENGTKISWPENDRGWAKVEKSLVTILNVNTNKLNGLPSFSTIRELGFGKKLDTNEILIGIIHDLAYECARPGGSHVIGWTIQNITTRDKLTAESQWKDGKITFTLKFEYQ